MSINRNHKNRIESADWSCDSQTFCVYLEKVENYRKGANKDMPKVFNVTADCKPDLHYMVNLDTRLAEIKELVDAGKYFTINRARQYGKTTILRALSRYLQGEYYVASLDFQTFGDAKFKSENAFSLSFARSFLRAMKRNEALCSKESGCKESRSKEPEMAFGTLEKKVNARQNDFELQELFENLSDICSTMDRKIVLIIDEVDSASNHQVFLDFLAQLRAYYIDRDVTPAFHAVVLAGVYDVKNLKSKIRPDDSHKGNSPWNIAADFPVELSFSKEDIEGMLLEYESDYQTGMNLEEMTGLLYDYTSGYPFLVSKLCKLIDEEVSEGENFKTKQSAWTKAGFVEAVKLLLDERNTLFESLSEKLSTYPELNTMLQSLLFTGKNIVYNFYEPAINIATMFGFVRNQNGSLVVANRIFDTWLYNLYLSASEMQKLDIYKASLQDKNQFVVNGRLNMRLVLVRFVAHFHDLYGDCDETFLEEEGRKYFLLYLRPIINGTGNYYIESRTRGLRRTDIIVDYHGEQYIIEMKIWHGQEYNNRGEKQLTEYLDAYCLNIGYMISFNFNKKKQVGVHDIVIGDKTLVEAVV